jgi:hypothetical protein
MDNVDVKLPESGTGFVTNNRGEHGEFQFGQQSTIDAALRTAAAWDVLHPNRPFSIGQISKEGGGDFRPQHQSHRTGLDIDVRPVRKDGQNLGVDISESQYHRALTTELIDLWWRNAPVQLVYFNDPTVVNAGLSTHLGGHNDHFHVRVRRKDGVIRIHDRGSDVAEMQTILGIEADGRFGPKTLLAVEQFQSDHGLVADGIVGPKTWIALRAV